jgi:hypothetical protein
VAGRDRFGALDGQTHRHSSLLTQGRPRDDADTPWKKIGKVAKKVRQASERIAHTDGRTTTGPAKKPASDDIDPDADGQIAGLA